MIEHLLTKRKTPKWLQTESIASVGSWEPLFFRRRMGGTYVDDEKYYAYEHSEAFVKEVLATGANILITAFSKNSFVDETEFELKKQLSVLCVKHGLRLAAYLRADQIYTECFTELIKKDDILAYRADGSIPVYGSCEWRQQVCFHKPKAMELFKRDIKRAVEVLKVDALHIDGFGFGGFETIDACRCEACKRDFTAFLLERYADNKELAQQRFGHSNLEGIEPPGMLTPISFPADMVLDPVWQEWVLFRCTWTATLAAEIVNYVDKLNSETAIFVNGAVAIRENMALVGGIELVSAAVGVDLLMNEDGYGPGMVDNMIIQRVRQHKMAAQTNCFLWNYMQGGADSPWLNMAHAAAFNRGRVTCLGFSYGCSYSDYFGNCMNEKKAFLAFLKDNWEHFQHLEELADIYVWRERTSMSFAGPHTYATTMQMEQLLIETRIPFTISMADFPANAKIVILPMLAFMDDELCQKVVDYVKNGGSVLIIGNTSAFDGWGRRRSDFGLRNILPGSVQLPQRKFSQHIAAAGIALEEDKEIITAPGKVITRQAGKGKVAYIAQIVPPTSVKRMLNATHRYDFSLDYSNWKIPECSEVLLDALKWLANDTLSIKVNAPRGVIANYYVQKDTGNLYIHLVNLTGKVVDKVKIEPSPSKVLSPDPGCSDLSKLDTYSIVCIENWRRK